MKHLKTFEMLKYKNRKTIDLYAWDKLVEDTYKRPYSFQQQDGCKSRGSFHITIPSKHTNDYKNDSVPEKINGPKMGVSFDAWLKRDPKKPIPENDSPWAVGMFWERNFYPDVQMVANDLYNKGLIESGDYTIDIDW